VQDRARARRHERFPTRRHRWRRAASLHLFDEHGRRIERTEIVASAAPLPLHGLPPWAERVSTAASMHAAPPRVRKCGQPWIEALAGIGFATPAFVLLLLTNLAPLVVLAFLSFTDYELGALDFASVGLSTSSTRLPIRIRRRARQHAALRRDRRAAGVLLSLLIAILIHGRAQSRASTR
jgi:hypothetical protein